MNKILIVLMAAIFASSVLATDANATYTSSADTSSVKSITLSGTGDDLKWSVDGYSDQGFKVVWSKNTNPVYPTREGDKYHYYSEPAKRSDQLEAFAGSGTYYVRVCEYLGGKCGVYSNQISLSLQKDGEMIACTMEYAPVCGSDGKTYSNKCMAKAGGVSVKYSGECGTNAEIIKIEDNAELLSQNKLDAILLEIKQLRSIVQEQQTEIIYLRNLLSGISGLTTEMRNSINSFITYGVDDNTKKLGAGERAAVMHSYKAAFGKLPLDEGDLEDIIKIANGRYPTETNQKAEEKAIEKFEKIYDRLPDMENPQDKAAITVMAYGLRQKAENRNLNSEKVGIGIFKNVFGRNPLTTEDWNTIQAIAYSGASK